MVDEAVRNIIKTELKKGYLLNKKGLQQLKNQIVAKTGSYKFLSLNNLKKWVSEIRKEEKKSKSRHQPESDTKEFAEEEQDDYVSAKIESIKNTYEVPVSAQQIGESIAERNKKVYYQSILFELSSMRQSLNKISKRLDSLQEMLEKESSA